MNSWSLLFMAKRKICWDFQFWSRKQISRFPAVLIGGFYSIFSTYIAKLFYIPVLMYRYYLYQFCYITGCPLWRSYCRSPAEVIFQGSARMLKFSRSTCKQHELYINSKCSSIDITCVRHSFLHSYSSTKYSIVVVDLSRMYSSCI